MRFLQGALPRSLSAAMTGSAFDLFAAVLFATVASTTLWRGPSDLAIADWSPSLLWALLLALLPLYAVVRGWARTDKHSRARTGLCVLMGAAIVLGSILDRRLPTPALLLVASAQITLSGGWRAAVALICASSLTLAVAYLSVGPLALALPTVAFYAAMQLLIVLLIEQARLAEAARWEAEAARTELQAMQCVLGDLIRERTRTDLAREIHDLVGSRLTGLVMTLQASPEADAGHHLKRASALAAELLEETRAAVRGIDLRNGVELDGALANVAAGFPAGLIRLEGTEGMRTRDPRVAHAIIRCVQEAISNAVRHGRAQQIVVSVTRNDTDLQVTIRDNGVAGEAWREGFGLRAMRGRVQELGGSVAWDAGVGFGTEIHVRIPESPVATPTSSPT